ncbi:MAG: hypothetical protein Q4D62_06640 [Planctomycetia bacterium]|nr:hypothetical protein [Planctomycetia bacterium]
MKKFPSLPTLLMGWLLLSQIFLAGTFLTGGCSFLLQMMGDSLAADVFQWIAVAGGLFFLLSLFFLLITSVLLQITSFLSEDEEEN